VHASIGSYSIATCVLQDENIFKGKPKTIEELNRIYAITVFDLYGGTVSSYLIATCVGRKKIIGNNKR
jgi:hypothetical protein